MNSLTENGVSFPVLMAYGLLTLLYLIILRLLLNLLQQIGDKHLLQKSVIDRVIHSTMNNRVETSMHAFDVYSVAIVIAKGGIATIAMAAIFILMVAKVGIFPAILLVALVVILLYAYNQWKKSRVKAGSIRAEVSQFVQKSGSIGAVLMLSIGLVALLFVMIVLH